jgi:hypothetical protein
MGDAMRLAALATGAGVPAGDFSGRVVELHAQAALVALSDAYYVTLIAPQLGRFPYGITLDMPPECSFRTLLPVDADIAARGGMLRVAGGPAIDLRNARPWRSRLCTLHMDLARAPVKCAYRTAWSAFDADGRGTGLPRVAGVTLERLTEATRHRDAVAAEAAMSCLVGLGEGRTPAGDDYLVGFCAALWAGDGAAKSFAAVLGRRLASLAIRTERLSRLYLKAAAVGEVPERIAAVAGGITAGGDEAEIGRLVAAALAVGHSSGAAALLGLLQGCAACAEAKRQSYADAVLTTPF